MQNYFEDYFFLGVLEEANRDRKKRREKSWQKRSSYWWWWYEMKWANRTTLRGGNTPRNDRRESWDHLALPKVEVGQNHLSTEELSMKRWADQMGRISLLCPPPSRLRPFAFIGCGFDGTKVLDIQYWLSFFMEETGDKAPPLCLLKNRRAWQDPEEMRSWVESNWAKARRNQNDSKEISKRHPTTPLNIQAQKDETGCLLWSEEMCKDVQRWATRKPLRLEQ